MNFLLLYNILFNELIFVFVLSKDRPLMALNKSPWVRRSSCSKTVTLHSKGLMHLYLLWLFFVFFFFQEVPWKKTFAGTGWHLAVNLWIIPCWASVQLGSMSSWVELWGEDRLSCMGSFQIFRVFIKYCVFPYNFVWLFWTLLVLLVFYLPGVCTHTDTKGKQKRARVRNILESF